MRILIHYPGKIHKQVDVILDNTDLYAIVKQLANDEKILQDYLNEENFYSRFITYKNGKRFYSFSDKCKNEDNIMIIAVNKLKAIKNVFEFKSNNMSNCSLCKNKNIIYIDNGILKKDANETYLCQDCFEKKVTEKAFENISHMQLKDSSIIDFGFSGERDSTVALYLLLQYRKEKGIKFKINCVFNAVGLGEYDKNRLMAAKVFYEKMCDEKDSFTINYLNMGFEEDFNKNKNNIDKITSKYCNICTRANGFREYGMYNNNKDLFTASGSGTIEDCFASKMMNKGETTASTLVNYNFLRAKNFRRMLILDGISEDIISIFACLNNINYYIGDCPLSSVSPNYLCRENALNPIKAKTDWITSTYGDIELKYNYTLMGRISEDRKINLRNKCIKLEDNFLCGINDGTLKNILHTVKNRKMPDLLEKEFYYICTKSKKKYLDENFEKYVSIFLDDYVKNNLILTLNNTIIKKFEGVYILYNNKTDNVELIELTKDDEALFKAIEKNKEIVFNDLNIKNDEEFLKKVKAIQKLLSIGAIKLKLPEKEKTREIDKIFIQDNMDILIEQYRFIIRDIFEVNDESIIFNDLNINKCNKDDIIIILENNEAKIKEWYSKLRNISSQVIYIHINPIITLFTNNYEYIEKNWNIMIDGLRNDEELEDDLKKKYRIQILSILSELMLCDFKTIKNNLKNYNVIYYVNIENGQKRKQLY